MSVTGRCNCGAVRYTIDADAVLVAACHCVNCKRSSGSAFSVNAVFPSDKVSVTGPLATYVDTDTRSGGSVLRMFCKECGSSIFSKQGQGAANTIVKVGTFDDPGTVVPTAEIWTDAALSWARLGSSVTSFKTNYGE